MKVYVLLDKVAAPRHRIAEAADKIKGWAASARAPKPKAAPEPRGRELGAASPSAVRDFLSSLGPRPMRVASEAPAGGQSRILILADDAQGRPASELVRRRALNGGYGVAYLGAALGEDLP